MAEKRKSNKIVGIVAALAIVISAWFIYREIQDVRAQDQAREQMFKEAADSAAARRRAPTTRRATSRRATTAPRAPAADESRADFDGILTLANHKIA